MARRHAALIAVFASILTACQQDAAFQREGAGASLYYAEMAESTANLARYFDLLCTNERIPLTAEPLSLGGPRTCDTGALSEAQWAQVVQAGYNDINSRCDAYLSWLERKRNERPFANQASAAFAGLLGGILTGAGATEALGYVALALGFGGTIYNAYQDSLLLGLETSTIKTIVDERRARFQEVFRDARYAFKHDAVRALRAYLRICTPATITMDVNTYSRMAASGQPITQPSLQDRELLTDRRALSTYTPPTASTPATALPRRGRPETPPAYKQVFAGEPWDPSEFQGLQAAFCLPEADRGRTSPAVIARMRANIALALGRARRDSLITRPDFARIQARTADTTGQMTCPPGLQNYFENLEYRNSSRQQETDLKALQEIVGDPAPAPRSLAEPAARDLIGRARVRCGLDNTGPLRNQMDEELKAKMSTDEPCRSGP